MFQDHPHRGQQSAELMSDQLPALGPLGKAQLLLTAWPAMAMIVTMMMTGDAGDAEESL